MKVIFIGAYCYDEFYKEEVISNNNNKDYFEEKILMNHDDPVHKWCLMLKNQGINVEFWYFSNYQRKEKIFIHKYGHILRRIPGRVLKLDIKGLKRINGHYSLSLFKLLIREKITHILYIPYISNGLWFDYYDFVTLFCIKNKIRLFPIYGGHSIMKTSLIKRKIKAFFLKKATMLLSQDSLELDLLRKNFNFTSNKVVEFKNPVYLSDFPELEKGYCKNKIKLTLEKKYFIYVGRIVKSKGIHHIINIMPKINGSNVHLLIIGNGPYYDELLYLIKFQGVEENVSILPYVSHEELVYYYRSSEALILASYSEGVPNVIQEAIACNTICIGTTVGGIPEMLRDGVGILIPPSDEVALIKAIKQVLNKKFNINQDKRKLLIKSFDFKIQSERLKRILQNNY